MILTETAREETLVLGSVKCCEWYREGTSGGTDGTGRNAQVGQPCRSQEEEWGKSFI